MTEPSTSTAAVAAVGVEVSSELVRALAVDSTGTALWAMEIPLATNADHDLTHAFGQVAARLEIGPAVAVRLASFPAGTTVQRFDVTDRSLDDLETRRDELFARDDVNATVVSVGRGTRYLVALRWDDVGAQRLRRLARTAGLTDVTIEAAPTSLHRVTPSDSTVVRRTADASSAWIMLCDEDGPLLATSLLTTRRDFPTATAGAAQVTTPTATLDQGSILAFTNGVVRGDADAVAMEPVGDAARAVAHGAALGALHDGSDAGDLVIRRSPSEIAESPWTVEQITVADDAPASSRWQRFVDRLIRRSTQR